MSFRQCLSGCLLAAATAIAPGIANAALLGVNPSDPKIDFGGAGVVDYKVATQVLTISGVPSTLVRTDPFLFVPIGATGSKDTKKLTIKFKVNPTTGQFAGSTSGGSDIQIIGSVDIDGDGRADYKDTLLEAQVSAFGSQQNAFGTTSAFDITATVTGGSLTSGSTPIYVRGSALAIQVLSEASTEYPAPFIGSFQLNFRGPAKGVIGTGEPVVVGQCKIEVVATCSTDGSTFGSKCRIANYKSPYYWDFEDRSSSGQAYKRYAYGLHGSPEPAWSVARGFEKTPVTFRYVVTNKGSVPISGIYLDDSFDIPVAGYPSTLDVGGSFTVTLVKNLRESLENTVLVTGLSGTKKCRDSDTVVIKDKLRPRYRNDDDDYEDKGKDDPVDRD